MDQDEYRRTYVVDPPPPQRFKYIDIFGTVLYYQDFEAAVDFYQAVLGPPGYIEGDHTRGWQIGYGWLTLLRGKNGNPSNVEVQFKVDGPEEAERMQRAFIDAGGKGDDPSDQLMFESVKFCPVKDPFGVDILVFSRNPID